MIQTLKKCHNTIDANDANVDIEKDYWKLFSRKGIVVG
jgi:hypothetical protein